MKLLDKILSSSHPSRSGSESETSALANAKPLFLIGPPRSGTTMLTRVLNSHSRILMTNETAVFLQLAESIRKSRIGRKEGMNYGKNSGKEWAEVLSSASRELVCRFYEKLAAKESKTELLYWGEKHPHFNRCLKFLSSQYPEAVYVYMIRDPRDSSCSIAEMNGKPIEAGMRVWKRISDAYEEFVGDKQDSNKFVIVKYEDFISDYKRGAEELFGQLGLTLDDSSESYVTKYKNVDAHTSSSFVFKGAALLKKTSRSRDFVEKSIGRWERDMSREQQEAAHELFSDFLAKYRYIQ